MKAFHGYDRQCAPPNYHGDHLGSAQVVTNGVGEIYEHIEYTPYGELWVDHTKRIGSEEGTPFRFTGKEFDEETGLYYYGARYLDPKTSRWISTDPAMGEYIPGAPINDEAKKRNQNLPGMGGVFNYVNLHVYHYAGNNPIKLIDPDGRADWNMVGKGLINIFKGVGKMHVGTGMYAVSGGGAVLSGGAATPLSVLGFVLASGIVANGFVQTTIGVAEVIGGLGAKDPIPMDVQDAIPDTLTQVVGVTGDSVVSSATGKPSTVMRNAANVLDTAQDLANRASVIETLVSVPGRLDEHNQVSTQHGATSKVQTVPQKRDFSTKVSPSMQSSTQQPQNKPLNYGLMCQ